MELFVLLVARGVTARGWEGYSGLHRHRAAPGGEPAGPCAHAFGIGLEADGIKLPVWFLSQSIFKQSLVRPGFRKNALCS